jgi:hypothetical protein
MNSPRLFAISTCALLLAACAPEPAPEQTDGAAETAAPVPELADAGGPAVEQPDSVETLMTLTFMPEAEHLWRAVSYVANEQGVTETMPETDADWSALRASANALIAAGDALRDTKRDIFNDFDASTASFQFTPEEIEQLLAEDPQTWQSYIERMQDRTRMTLQAIELRDVMGLVDFGAQINEACDGCHAAYWYRPPQQ